MWYENHRDLNQPPEDGWDKTFQAKGRPLPRSWTCVNVLDSSKSYVSCKPDDAKHGISAAAALLELRRRGELHLAHHAWQTQALKPHTICQHGAGREGSAVGSAALGESLFFVIARGAYAARVCPVRRVGKDLLALQMQHWSWLVVTNAQDHGTGKTFPPHSAHRLSLPPRVCKMKGCCNSAIMKQQTQPWAEWSRLVCRIGECW